MITVLTGILYWLSPFEVSFTLCGCAGILCIKIISPRQTSYGKSKSPLFRVKRAPAFREEQNNCISSQMNTTLHWGLLSYDCTWIPKPPVYNSMHAHASPCAHRRDGLCLISDVRTDDRTKKDTCRKYNKSWISYNTTAYDPSGLTIWSWLFNPLVRYKSTHGQTKTRFGSDSLFISLYIKEKIHLFSMNKSSRNQVDLLFLNHFISLIYSKNKSFQ